MSSLNAFLHPEQTGNKDVVVSERFKENGKLVPFVIRPITQTENEQLIKKHTKSDKKGNQVFDRMAYVNDLTAVGVVEPDLENAELQKAYKSLGSAKTLAAMLYAGEFTRLAEAVQEISGIDADINEDMETVKNG